MINLGTLHVGLDAGTANTLLYVRGRGIALNEPSVLTIRTGSGKVEFVGEEAEVGRGRIPRKFQLQRPISRGTVTNAGLFEAMLSAFLRKAGVKRRFRRLRLAVAVPSGSNQSERMALVQLVRKTIDADICPMDQALAAGIGAGLPVRDLKSCMIVGIGAGTTQIAILSRGAVVQARCLPIAGQDIDAAIIARIEATHQLLIGEPTAQRLKIRIGSAGGAVRRGLLPVVGRSVAEGVPRGGVVTARQVQEAILPVLKVVGDAVQETLQSTPPARIDHVADTGIVLTGGSASLDAIDEFLSRHCGVPVRVTDDPASCVVRGLGSYLNQLPRDGYSVAGSDWPGAEVIPA
jgi:rod shape-determining protein MreB